MRKIKIAVLYPVLVIMGLLLASSGAQAQSVDEALRLLEREKFQSATASIRAVLAKDPDQAENYYYAGYIYLHVGNSDSSKYFFDKGVAIDEKEPLNYVGQGRLALDNSSQAARALFEKALSLSNSRNEALVYNKIAEALLHTENKDPNKALTYLQQALTFKKGKDEESKIDAETHMLMGDAYLAQMLGGKAIKNYETAASLNSSLTAKAHVKIGRIYLSAKNGEAALSEFEKAVKANPEYAPVYKDLGELYFSYKKDVDKAQEMYRKYLNLSDVKTGSRSRYAAFLYVSKDFENAIVEMRKALKTEPDNFVMYRLLGYSLFETGDYEGANEAMKKYFSLVEPDKTLASDFEYSGKIFMKLGKDSLAIENFYTAFEKDTTNVTLLNEVAQTYRKDKKYAQSAKLYDLLLDEKENPSTNDYYEAGLSYLYSQQYGKADSAFSQVIKLSPNHYIGYYMMANTKFYQSQDDKAGLAKPYYEKVIEILEADSNKSNKGPLITAYSYLATYYTQNEDLDTAKDYWEKVEAVDPGNANAKQFFDYYKQVQAYKNQQQGNQAQ